MLNLIIYIKLHNLFYCTFYSYSVYYKFTFCILQINVMKKKKYYKFNFNLIYNVISSMN